MSNYFEFFEIKKLGEAIQFINHSKFMMIVSVIPKKPKRKYHDLLMVQPESFKILDKEWAFDITMVSFRFVDEK